jgi:ribonuclease HI
MACDYKMAMKHDNFVHPVPRTQIMIGWTALEAGWVRINSDGAGKENGYAGCGGFIRSSDKEWLGGFPAYVAELWGIFEGLKLARRLGFHKVEVCFDSRAVYNNIVNGMNSNVMGESLVQRIHHLMELDWEVMKMKHIYREQNY